MADETMRVSQTERVCDTGVEVLTTIICGLRYEDSYIVSFAFLAASDNVYALMKQTRRERVNALFSATWDKLGG